MIILLLIFLSLVVLWLREHPYAHFWALAAASLFQLCGQQRNKPASAHQHIHCSSTGQLCERGKKEKKNFKNEFLMEVQCTSQSKGNRFHVILKSFGESWVPFGVKRRSPFPACCSQEGQLLYAAHCACSQSRPSPHRWQHRRLCAHEPKRGKDVGDFLTADACLLVQ